ncbi:hypothetical protein [Paenibacillus thiaminolyticus]|uniref:Uncharacterized protein n=1 Tax=Paenibacillus thiaminolyticus TaxID=49283 RepID=A0A3A3GCE1_PANTH|nr:hypothetical protein [Paenibacillus thiaminolyticus]RJG21340.1 hypothetical protein DQX05_21805 [Paenibacillus thiaminolyticus]
MDMPDFNPSISVWRAKDGSVPIFDDPTLKFTMLRWQGRPDTNFEVTLFRVQTGQITKVDIEIAVALANAQALTEKQLRRMFRHRFRKDHELATRLRFLQKLAWFDGWHMESDFNSREYTWTIGVAAQNYLRFVMGMTNLINPFFNSRRCRFFLSVCAINEIKHQMMDLGVLQSENDFSFQPYLGPNVDQPFAQVKMVTPFGPIVFYVERLDQTRKPIKFMSRRINMYLELVEKNENQLPNPTKEQATSMLLWSCGSEEAIREIVGSLYYLPENIPQLFIVDEEPDIRKAFRVVQKGEGEGEVMIRPFVWDFIATV